MDGSHPGRVQRTRHDSALGRWHVDICAPCPALQPHVDMLWYGEGQVAYQRDRILPAGGAFLLINLGPTQYRIDPGPPERREAFTDIWYSGLQRGPIDTEAPHGNALLGVALRPSGSHAWTGWRADALADRTLPLSDLIGDAPAAELHQQLLACRSSEARFARVESWLLRQLHPRRATHTVVDWALAQLDSSGGQIGIATLARESGFSRKHLATLFGDQVGLGPKALARIYRFQHALRFLQGATRVPWTELAARCGYFDQAHLIHDFQAFCGLSPGEFLRHARADASSIVLR